MQKNDGKRQSFESKLRRVRETEGWSVVELARSADITAATLSKAESGEQVRRYVWGKILKGINAKPDKTKSYSMSEIR